ncbi:hypothetical protein BDW22DRAFT_1471852 [Trametopsis cervina]|nr:hypothetical protein BDW22DRAFT_1471852 [Trametopsis cervina]
MATPTAPIILYDIPSTTVIKAWSPSIWKVRFALNIKRLHHKTEWVEYPDIENLYKKLNLPAAVFKEDGTPYYSLPVMHDPSTNTTIAESFAIVKYLDKTYPHSEPILPEGTLIFHAVFLTEWKKMQERLQEYYRPTREAHAGKRLEDIRGEVEWKVAEDGYGIVKGWLDEGGEGNLSFMGEKVCFADLVLVSDLMWAKICLGEDSEEWKRICGWHGGRWKAIVDRFAQYTAVS